MKPRVETRRYESTHGHKPRGRGQWAFFLGEQLWFAPGCLSYGEARKRALQQAGQVEATVVTVAP